MLMTLLRKDLVLRWRSPVSTLVMLLFPFMMAGLIGAVSSGSGSEGLPPIKMLLLDREDGFLGNFLAGATPPDDAELRLDVVKVGEEGFAMMEDGQASGMLIIPENFTEDLLDGRPVTLEFLRNPQESIKPEILEQGLQVVATYLDVAVKALGSELSRLDGMFDADEMPPVMVVTSLIGEFYEEVRKAERYLFPPVITLGTEKEEGAPRPNLFGYVLVMVSVMSVLFVAIRAVTDLYEDARTGMLRRQLSTPIPVGMLVASKLVFAVLFGVLVMVILLVAGALLGWFDGMTDLPWIFVHTVAFALAAGGLMTVLVALVRTEKQAGLLSWIVVMVMSAVGGSFFPAEFMPAGIRGLSQFTLNYWAVEGYLDLIVRGDGMAAALPATLVLAAVGVVLAVAGQLLMQHRLREVLR